MELLKLLSANEIVAQVVSFLILFFLLRAFAWRPILKTLEERRLKIVSDLKGAQDAKDAAEKRRAEYEERLAAAEAETRAKIHEAVLEGNKIREELKVEARAQAEKIVEEAKAEVERAQAKAREDMRDEVVDLVVNATERLLEEKVTEDDNERIIRKILKEAGGAK